ncbi:hypothetical protein [Nocardioides faecalis]|uniref:hypothetical protein n=1 Tax=Nocardioides faecalis TaxID=2803858 RepID=UPI001BD04F94|nr:hypothetical protein [Nocardioides faecalis]MBS4752261.1 hypothetical protein [Nocardioides faecalis]QVI57570.1 hypothetical protein KG111_10750 [Nocardioides faecalis]
MSTPPPAAGARPRPAGPLLTVPVALGAGLGLLAGWLWWTWWGPAPTGKIFETRVGLRWYPDPFDAGIARDFDGTATFVILGLGLGVLLGVVAGVLCRRAAVPGLVAALVGAVVATVAMVLVGTALSPPDPATLVSGRAAGDTLPGHLHVGGWTPYLAWPVGVALGYFAVMIAILNPREAQGQPSTAAGDPAGPSADVRRA